MPDRRRRPALGAATATLAALFLTPMAVAQTNDHQRTASAAPSRLPGPVSARVIRVIDGDTIDVDAFIWLQQSVRVRVRIGGIDTPELRSRCAAERERARQVRQLVGDLLDGDRVSLLDIRYGKYARRVIAKVRGADGRDVARVLISRGLARPYAGRRRQPWCDRSGRWLGSRGSPDR